MSIKFIIDYKWLLCISTKFIIGWWICKLTLYSLLSITWVMCMPVISLLLISRSCRSAYKLNWSLFYKVGNMWSNWSFISRLFVDLNIKLYSSLIIKSIFDLQIRSMVTCHSNHNILTTKVFCFYDHCIQKCILECYKISMIL